MGILTVLPFFCFGAWTAGFRRLGFGWRQSLLFATFPFSTGLVFVTEGLSAFHQLTRLAVSVCWLGGGVIAAGWAFGVVRRPGLISAANSRNVEDKGLDGWDRGVLLGAAFLAVLVGLTAVVCAPNTWDAMKYHLPRVIEWIGNRSVYFYPTVDRQQLTMPPLSEYFMLHLEILLGSDRLVSLASWFAYLGSIAGMSLVAQELGGDRRMQIFAAVLGTTVPSALLAASSAKNDNMLAYWLVASLYMLLLWRREQKAWVALGIGASFAGAVFTKGTAYVFLPWLALICWMLYGRQARLRLIWNLPIVALVMISICGPFWLRNYQMAGTPLGLPYYDGEGNVEGRKFAVSHLSPSEAAAGLIRNLAVDLSLPSQRANDFTTRICSNLMWTIGVDPNDFGQLFRSQTGGAHPFHITSRFRDEYYGGNLWNLLLFLAACLLLLLNLRARKVPDGNGSAWKRQAGWMALGLIGAFAMFSAMVRWGPWNGKYQMPVFVLSVAFVALVLSRFLSRRVILALEVCLLLFSVPLAAMNTFRPWISVHGARETLVGMPRDRTYFLNDYESRADSFVPAASAAKRTGCHHVGLDVGLEHYEYPMMALIERGDPDYRFQYLDVENPSTAYTEGRDVSPCVVVCLGCANSAEKLKLYGMNRRTEIFGGIAVFSTNGGPVVVSPQSTASAR